MLQQSDDFETEWKLCSFFTSSTRLFGSVRWCQQCFQRCQWKTERPYVATVRTLSNGMAVFIAFFLGLLVSN